MLDSERMAKAAWTRALTEKGYQLTDADYLRLVGRTTVDAQSILYEIYGADFAYEQILKQCQVYYEADIEANGIPLKPGLLELLDFLEEKRLPKAVASSTRSSFTRRKLEKVGILHRFSAVIGGDMVAQGKPAPDLFLEAARQIGFTPECCVVLEDSEAGIHAAHSAGMLAIMIPDLKPATPEIRALAYQVLPSLAEVIPLFARFAREGLPGTPGCAA